MPGYYVHLAVSNKEVRRNRSFVLGVEIPDLLKKYVKLYGLDGARIKYNSIKTTKMPEFSYFESRVQQQENDLSNNGMHYGWSSNPDIMCYWNSLGKCEKQNPFYIGYLWHLLTDLFMYKYLDIEGKLNRFVEQHKADKNISELIKLEHKKLHNDWDKINAKIITIYPDVVLTPEVLELDLVKFINDDELTYVDWNIIKAITGYMRTINPLNQEIDKIIDEIMTFMKEQNDYSVDTLNKKLILSKFK